MNIIGRYSGQSEAYQPTAGLEDEQIDHVQRYLDAVRSNLLFAKSVILVEGDAEEILIPILVKKALGVSLDELGISIVNIRSTGFKNVACLFHESRIRKRCSIVTDLDKSIIDTSPESTDDEAVRRRKRRFQESEKRGLSRKTDLDTTFSNNPWVNVFFASHTFEIDFVMAGNKSKVIEVIPEIYSDEEKKRATKQELESKNIAEYGQRVLAMARALGKGWFAILLGKRIDENVCIPSYIIHAIRFALPELKKEVLVNIIKYRLRHQDDEGDSAADSFKALNSKLRGYLKGEIEFSDLRDMVSQTIPADSINDVLKAF